MRVEKAIKKIEKALGVKVEKLYENAEYYAKYAFNYEDRICTFLTHKASYEYLTYPQRDMELVSGV